jgi:aarF domain-containing kinase
MLSLDLAFWKSRFTQWIRGRLGLRPGFGFEDEMERSMRVFAKANMGVDVAPGAFSG